MAKNIESDINFESLQREILEAEEYLVRNSRDFSAKDDSSKDPPVRRSLDVSRKNELLEQIGRKPLSHSSSSLRSSAERNRAKASAAPAPALERTPNKYMDSHEREKLLTRLVQGHGAEDSGERDPGRPDENARDMIEGADGADDTLYYASDLAATAPTGSHTFLNPGAYGGDSGLFALPDSAAATYDRAAPGGGSARPAPQRESTGSSSRYDRVPVFKDDSPLDKTGRFSAGRRPQLTEYAVRATAAEQDMQRECNAGQGGPKRYLKTIPTLKEEAAEQFKRDHPFAPSVAAAAPGDRPLSGRDINAHMVGGGRFLPVSKTGKPKQAELVDRIEKVREMHEKSLRKREEDKQLLERAELQLCTFKPEISKRSERIVSKQQRDPAYRTHSPRNRATSPGRPQSSTRVFADEPPPPPPGSGGQAAAERLFRDAWTRKADAVERSRRLREANERGNSFRPAINPATDAILSRSESEYRPIYERLGDVQRSRSALRDQTILEQENDRKVDFTFTPEICEKSRLLAENSKRTGADAKSRPQSAPSGRPTPSKHGGDDSNRDSSGDSHASVSTRSNQSAEGDLSAYSTDVSERLLAKGRETQRRKVELLKQREAEDAQKAQRVVPTSKGTNIIAANNDGVKLTFLDRQKYFDLLAKRHAAERKAADDENAAKLFRPQVCPGSESILSDARPEILLEGPQERAHRMSGVEKRRMDARRQEIEQEVYNENDYSFVPNIDKVSRALGRASSIEELHENRRGERARMNAVRKAEDSIAAECSFRPKINRKYPSPNSATSAETAATWSSCPVEEEEGRARVQWLGDRPNAASVNLPEAKHGMRINLREPEKMARDIRLHLAEKEENRREILAEREILELQDCTFRPKVPKHKPSTYNGPVVVRGIARHLELQNLSEKKRKEKAQREKDAFRVKGADKFRRTGDGNTVVEAFALSESSNKMSRSVAEQLENEYMNMTFTPNTLDASRRSLARSYV